MRAMRRRTRLTGVLAGAFLLLLVGCAPADDPPEDADPVDEPEDVDEEVAEPEETIPVTFAASAPPSSIGLIAAVIAGEGIDAEHGLEMQFSEFAPDDAEIALLTGQVETGFFPIVAWAHVRAEGEEIVFLGPIQENHGAVIVQEDSEFQSLEDLQGHTIATLSPVSGLYTTMQVLAAELGMSWEGDFDVVSGPPPALISFIETAEVDAIIHFEPNTSTLLATGDFRVVMTLGEQWEELTGAPLFMLGLGAQRAWVEENPETARRVSAMMQDVLQRLHDDPELVGRYLETFDLDEAVVEVAKERMSRIYIPQDPAEIEDNVQLILERALELGIIDEIPEPIFEQP
jgi:ABC-type nitrate/sulfonate/bicarbonate transport system substrate-binding protein